MRSMRTLICLFSIALFLGPAQARTIEDVHIPESVKVEGQTLKLNGAALREATVLAIDVYVIGLYRLTKTRSANTVLSCDEPIHLAKHFVMNVDRDEMLPDWQEAVHARAKKMGLSAKRQIEQMLKGVVDTKDGQVLAITWMPDKGLRMTLDGRTTSFVPNASKKLCQVVYAGYIGGMANSKVVARGLVGG